MSGAVLQKMTYETEFTSKCENTVKFYMNVILWTYFSGIVLQCAVFLQFLLQCRCCSVITLTILNIFGVTVSFSQNANV